MKTSTTLFVDNLTVIDCTYFDIHRGLVGESWIVDLRLSGELDSQSMMMDFGVIKKSIKKAIDETIDHTLVVPKNSPGVTYEAKGGELFLDMSAAKGLYIKHVSPSQAVYLLPVEEVTMEAVEKELLLLVEKEISENIADVSLELRVEEHEDAYYHYTHGLKKHQGNCQRIAHGHRSRIEIYINDIRNKELEIEVQGEWKDVYIGSEEDVVEIKSGYITFAYKSEEGCFRLTLPEKMCDIIPCDSTVECISSHLASKLKRRFPDDAITIKAFEGVNKGALSQC